MGAMHLQCVNYALARYPQVVCVPLDTALWTLLSTLLGGLFFREQPASLPHFAAGCALVVLGVLLFSWGTALTEAGGDDDEEDGGAALMIDDIGEDSANGKGNDKTGG